MTSMQAMFENYYQYFTKLEYKLLKIQNNNLNIICGKKSNKVIYISYNKFLNLNRYVESKFISRSLWHKFINQYWQETIFISFTNNLSENYINQLKTNNLSIYKDNDYKIFLLNFNKDLINGKIHVSLNRNFNNNKSSLSLIIYNKNKCIKYIWRKGLNWYLSSLYFKYISVKQKLLTNIPLIKLKNININSLPIFTIINQNNKLIMAESADKILMQKNLLELLYNWYNMIFFNNLNIKKLYTGLLFINPQDALEYKDYIKVKYLQSSQKNLLKFFIGHFNLYYKLLYFAGYGKEFRLIPDLKEISDLIYKYQYYKNIRFDPKQKYGKDYFQGQPIYIIEALIVKNKKTNKFQKIDYLYSLKKNNKIIKYKAIFLNYETAIIAWNKFKEEYINYKLPQKPMIFISNLQDFIKTYNNNNFHFIFIPSPKTYSFIKNYKQIQKQISLKYVLINQSLYIKSLCQRLIWSLTSRQPTNM